MSHKDSFVASGNSPTQSDSTIPPDLVVENHGTIFLLRPLTPAASSWIEENLPEDCTKFGTTIVVEHRYIADIVRGAMADGLEVQ